ncbi:hypothetical protein D3C86_1764370 [compost metagenome]
MDHDRVGRSGYGNFVHHVTPHAGQGRLGVAEVDLDPRATARQRHQAVAVIDAQFELVRFHAGLVGGAQLNQPIIDQAGDVGPVGDNAEHGRHEFFP